MQFGILLYPFTVLADLAFCRYCIPMDSPRPIRPAELEFFNKGTGRGNYPNEFISHLVGLERLFTLTSFPLAELLGSLPRITIYCVLTRKYVLYSSFGGYIH